MSSGNPETRIKILQACLGLLENGGGKGVRMSDIARSAGVTRQAVYLHFANRADLLVAATHFLDEQKGSEARLAASRQAGSGIGRLEAFIDAWGSYIPEIYPVAKALLAMSDTDEEAASAWQKRMRDMREGCEAALRALADEDKLSAQFPFETAVDVLWTLLSVRNWEHWTQECGWSQEEYLDNVTELAGKLFVKGGR